MTYSMAVLVLIQVTCVLQALLIGLSHVGLGMSHNITVENSVMPDPRPVIALDLDDVLSATNAVAAQCVCYGYSFRYLSRPQ